MTQQATEDVLVRIPPLKQSDRIVITRADHGGYVVEVEAIFPGSHTARTTAAFSTYVDLQDWLHQVFIRWLPVTEWIPPAPPKRQGGVSREES